MSPELNNEPRVELTLEARMERMAKMSGIFSYKREDIDMPDSDGPVALDHNETLRQFETALEQAVIVAPEDKEFNLKLDKKLEEYRARQKKYESDKNSIKYKDPLYKLIIANHLRIEGAVKLEDSYKNVEEMIGGGSVDIEVFRNAWKVIKSYAEGKAGNVLGGTGF